MTTIDGDLSGHPSKWLCYLFSTILPQRGWRQSL